MKDVPALPDLDIEDDLVSEEAADVLRQVVHLQDRAHNYRRGPDDASSDEPHLILQTALYCCLDVGRCRDGNRSSATLGEQYLRFDLSVSLLC